MGKKQHQNFIKANKFPVATATTLIFFGILNIFKTAYPSIKTSLTFHRPIGPLSGVYTISLLVFLLLLIAPMPLKIKRGNYVFWYFAISVVAFFFLVSPPIFEPIAHFLGK